MLKKDRHLGPLLTSFFCEKLVLEPVEWPWCRNNLCLTETFSSSPVWANETSGKKKARSVINISLQKQLMFEREMKNGGGGGVEG
jgi:hypothetical protein